MIDITSVGTDLNLFDTQVEKAGNILSIQLGSLEYAKGLGIDLRYFLSEDFRFQNESFKAYLIQILANNSINVSEVVDMVEALSSQYTFNITPDETSTSFLSR